MKARFARGIWYLVSGIWYQKLGIAEGDSHRSKYLILDTSYVADEGGHPC